MMAEGSVMGGWGDGGRKTHEEGDISIRIADSRSTAGTDTTL